MCLCGSFLVRIAGGGAAPSPLHPPTRFYVWTGSPCYLLYPFSHKHRLFGFILFFDVWYLSILVPMYFFLGTRCGRRRCPAPPICFDSLTASLTTYSCSFWFFHKHQFFRFLCASFLVRIAGGGAAPSPLHPPTRFYVLIGSPCYLLLRLFVTCVVYWGSYYLYRYLLRLVCLCASVLVRIAGGGAAPSPLHPPTRFYVVSGSSCYRLLRLFCICIVYLGSSYRIAGGGACTPPPAFMF